MTNETQRVTQVDRDAAEAFCQLNMLTGPTWRERVARFLARHRQSSSNAGGVGEHTHIKIPTEAMPKGERRDAVIAAAMKLAPYSADPAGTPTRDGLVFLNAAIKEAAAAHFASLSTPTAEPISEPTRRMEKTLGAKFVPTPDRIGKDAVREALAEILPAFRKFLRSEIDGDPTEREMQKFGYMYERASAALSATPAQEGVDFITVPPPDIWKDLSAQPVDETERLRRDLAQAREAILAFAGPWATQYARDFGLPDGHLHPTHYDILAKAGGRMDSFTRAALSDRPQAEGES